MIGSGARGERTGTRRPRRHSHPCHAYCRADGVPIVCRKWWLWWAASLRHGGRGAGEVRGRSSPSTAISRASDRSGRSAPAGERRDNGGAVRWVFGATAGFSCRWWPAGPGGGDQLLELVPQQLRVRVDQCEELRLDVLDGADVGVRRRIVPHDDRRRSRGRCHGCGRSCGRSHGRSRGRNRGRSRDHDHDRSPGSVV